MINKKIKALLFVCMVASIGGSKGSIMDNLSKYGGAALAALITSGSAVYLATNEKLRANSEQPDNKDKAILTGVGTVCLLSLIATFKLVNTVI